MPAAKRTQAPPRIRIRPLSPVIDAGRYAPKRCVGDAVTVAADVFSDGHEKLRAVVRYRAPGGRSWLEAEMHPVDAHHNGVRWQGAFPVEIQGSWEFSVEAWIDLFATWRDEIQRKVAAAQDDLSGELSEGVVLLERAKPKGAADKRAIAHALSVLNDDGAAQQTRWEAALSPELAEAMERSQGRHGMTRMEKALPLEVDRVRGRFGSWYEVFPRSWGGIKGVEALVPELSAMGFDVVYMTPIHPIGVTNRKGRNNTLVAGPDDPGSPYAVGGKEGGHDAVHPDLGTVDDVRALCATAREHGMDVCMDFAINA
ncbi:MAG TPA: maltotransferase domain-containing protein, partial [Solirubrobacteraceae bacterium]|nr:maltotransferase domain-containing protein [Solirubrobacteraceae bacterium]